ncbi:MAG: hypothetical protein Q7R87_04505 [Nanoarchaeota archaeon]|nr:hypothetical protein [Nanoarchaeota archaeon]
MSDTQNIRPVFPTEESERLRAIVRAVHLESKALTILALSRKGEMTAREIRKELQLLVGNDSNIGKDIVFGGYCKGSLYETGLVNIKDERRFSLTQEGDKYGAPLSALTVDWVARNKIGISRILGHFSSNGQTNAPLNRLSLIETLVQSDKPLTLPEIHDRTNIDKSACLINLLALEKAGLVAYDSVNKRVDSERVWKRKVKESEASLRDEGYTFYKSWIVPIKSALLDEQVLAGIREDSYKKLTTDSIIWEGYGKINLGYHQQSSRKLGKKRGSVMKDLVLDFIPSNEEGVALDGLVRTVGLSASSVYGYVNTLVKDETVRKEKREGRIYIIRTRR